MHTLTRINDFDVNLPLRRRVIKFQNTGFNLTCAEKAIFLQIYVIFFNSLQNFLISFRKLDEFGRFLKNIKL